MDLSFKFGGERLNIRVGVLIIRDGKLLIAHSDRPYWHTVGGRIHLGESSLEAAVRECREETGLEMKVDRLAFTAETFFKEEASGEQFHEITFYYLMEPDGREDEIPQTFSEGEMTERLGWFDIETLEQVDLRPAFLASELKKPFDGPRHIIVKG